MRPGQGFALSRDAGDTWERPSAGLEHHYLWGLAVDPDDPETVIVSAAHSPNQAHNPTAAESAIYRRSGGRAWERVTGGMPAGHRMLGSGLAASPGEPGGFLPPNKPGRFRSADDRPPSEAPSLPRAGPGGRG